MTTSNLREEILVGELDVEVIYLEYSIKKVNAKWLSQEDQGSEACQMRNRP